MTNLQADRVRRLNVLLGLPEIREPDIRELDENEWSRLLDQIFFAVSGRRDRRELSKNALFYKAMTREGLRAAQEGLEGLLPLMAKNPGVQIRPFKLSKQYLILAADNKGFYSRRDTEDGPTLIYETLSFLLEIAGIKPGDLLVCASEQCQRVFVPLRKPHKGRKSYCSAKCSNLAAVREYRKRKAEELRPKERERSHQRYLKKIREKYPTARVNRRPLKRRSRYQEPVTHKTLGRR